VFHLQDSYTQLPNSLETLAKTLCPHLGSKGSIAHDEVQMSSLQENRAQLLDYMELDISLLGDVMLRAKSIYWTRYNVDIGVCLTLSSLAKKYIEGIEEPSPSILPESRPLLERERRGGGEGTRDSS
jgi:hypothetical protein